MSIDVYKYSSSTTAVFVIKIVFAGFSFLIMLLAARILGSNDFGTFAYLWGWIMLLVFPCKFGLDELAVRLVPILSSDKNWAMLSNFLSWSVITTVIVSSSIVLLWGVTMTFIADQSQINNECLFGVAFNVIPLAGCCYIFGLLRGLNQPIIGQALDAWRTMLFSLFLVVITVNAISPNVFLILWLGGISTTIALITGIGYVIIIFRKKNYPITLCLPEHFWWRDAITFAIMSSFIILNKRADVVMLGLLSSSEDVAYYTVAARGSELISLVLMSLNTVLAAKFAFLWSNNQKRELQHLVTATARMAGIIMICMVILLFLCDTLYLGLFGLEFVAGTNILHILLLIPIFQAVSGSSHVILSMTGRAKLAAYIIGSAGCINIILNIILIPRFGGTGAATATVISTILWVTGSTVAVIVKLRLYPTPFGQFSIRKC